MRSRDITVSSWTAPVFSFTTGMDDAKSQSGPDDPSAARLICARTSVEVLFKPSMSRSATA